jgi:hypothetical protein
LLHRHAALLLHGFGAGLRMSRLKRRESSECGER